MDELEEAEKLLRSWNDCHGAFYQVSASDLLWNLRGQDIMRYWCAEIGGVRVLWAEAGQEGMELGIPPGDLWLSLHGEIRSGKEDIFVAAVEGFARERCKDRLAVAGDEFHFLPGIPLDEEPSLRLMDAFRRAGFLSAAYGDLIGSVKSEKCAEYTQAKLYEARARQWLFQCLCDDDGEGVAELEAFLKREFGGRWWREWRVWSRRGDIRRALWGVLRNERGAIIGFSRLAVRGRSLPLSEGWNPAALRLPLAIGASRDPMDACLGPIGVSGAERGRGAGGILLGLAVHQLRLLGADMACIDWTDAYRFYEPLGWRVARRYSTISKRLL